MSKKPTITRKQYKEFKKMDHQTMESFIITVYNEGFLGGKMAAVNKIDPSRIAIAISKVKGIGEHKKDTIMKEIGKLFVEEQENLN